MTRFSHLIKRRHIVLALSATLALLAPRDAAIADEGGVSFWLPGTFGSLAAVPPQPGLAAALIYYHTSVSAGANKPFRIGGGIQAGVDARADLVFGFGTYTFAEPVLGARATIGLGAAFGRNAVDVSATLTGPFGNTISGARSDSLTSFSDLYPKAALAWNHGVHNVMVYTQWGLPVGDYDANRLANIGIGHWSADGGAGYTYFNPHTGHEFSSVLGFTYNFKNPSTDYQNGVDAHLDWALSKFIIPQLHIGLVGYFYNQLTGDSGAGATLGEFKSRVAGIGPQIGYLFPVGDKQGYINLKGFKEFNAQNRPEGWNMWLTLSIGPAAPTHTPVATRMVYK